MGPEALRELRLPSARGAMRDDGEDFGLPGRVWGEVLLPGVPGGGVERRASKQLRGDGRDEEGI